MLFLLFREEDAHIAQLFVAGLLGQGLIELLPRYLHLHRFLEHLSGLVIGHGQPFYGISRGSLRMRNRPRGTALR